MTNQLEAHISHNADLAEEQAAAELAEKIDVSSTSAITSFGQHFESMNAGYADSLLKKAFGHNPDELGKQLEDVLKAARKFEVAPKSTILSNVPILGALIARASQSRNKLLARFTSMEMQINDVLASIDSSFDALERQCRDLESMHDSVESECMSMGVYKRACEIKLSTLTENSDTTYRSQDYALVIDALEKRITDLAVLKQSAKQTLPMLRLMSANSAALIDKFKNIKTLTIPTWKRSFAIALSLNEQRNAVALADSIDDATNHFLIKNAEMLQENTIATIKSNQRLAVDVATLEKVHATVVSTFEEAKECFAEGRIVRQEALTKLQKMDVSLSKQSNLMGLPASENEM